MNEFEQFSKAAMLYAENAPTVEAVRKIFEQELNAYLDALADAVREEVLPLTFAEERTGKYRYWCISEPGSSRKDQCRFWFTSTKPDIVIPGKLTLCAYRENMPADLKIKIANLADNSPIRDYCRPGKSYSYLNVEISIDPADRIHQPAKVIAEALRQIHKIDQSFK